MSERKILSSCASGLSRGSDRTIYGGDPVGKYPFYFVSPNIEFHVDILSYTEIGGVSIHRMPVVRVGLGSGVRRC